MSSYCLCFGQGREEPECAREAQNIFQKTAMISRFIALLIVCTAMFGSGAYTGWKVARWVDPVLEAKSRAEAVQGFIGGLFQ